MAKEMGKGESSHVDAPKSTRKRARGKENKGVNRPKRRAKDANEAPKRKKKGTCAVILPRFQHLVHDLVPRLIHFNFMRSLVPFSAKARGENHPS